MEIRFLDQKIEMEKCKEGQEIFDLKPLTKEEIVWLEEHFIDFAREQYLVRWDEAQRWKELQRQNKWGNKVENSKVD